MNRRLSKKINKKTIEIFLGWLKSIVDESQHKEINPKDYKSYVPENAYYWRKATLLNSVFTPRWIKRKLKNMYKANPSKRIEDYVLSDFK